MQWIGNYHTHLINTADFGSTWVWASSPVTIFPTVRRAGMRTVADGCLAETNSKLVAAAEQIEQYVKPKQQNTKTLKEM